MLIIMKRRLEIINTKDDYGRNEYSIKFHVGPAIGNPQHSSGTPQKSLVKKRFSGIGNAKKAHTNNKTQ